MKMENEYHQVTSQLDPREILRYLNNLGIHNISGEVLKYFITDLKKLIRYDLERRENTPLPEPIGPERLHSASTFSSRIRSKINDGCPLTCTRDCVKKRRPLTVRNVHSAPNLVQEKDDKPLRRACSCVRVERKSDRELAKDKASTATSSYNLIKVPIQPVKKKCDPVSLYHYYTSLWAKYKSNVPGENDRSELRWNVRQKMVGQVVTKPTASKVSPVEKDKPSKKHS